MTAQASVCNENSLYRQQRECMNGTFLMQGRLSGSPGITGEPVAIVINYLKLFIWYEKVKQSVFLSPRSCQKTHTFNICLKMMFLSHFTVSRERDVLFFFGLCELSLLESPLENRVRRSQLSPLLLVLCLCLTTSLNR